MAFTSESSDTDSRIPNLPSPDSGQKSSTQKRTERKTCKCDFEGCTASFSRPWRLAAHVAVHLGKKPFPCNVDGCDKAYTSSYHLRRHKLSHHSSTPNLEKQIKCEFEGCTAVFNLRQNERRHFKRTHEKRTCQICGLTFPKQSSLKSHEFYHTGQAPHKCEICGVGCVTKGSLTRHYRCHKEHMCPISGCIQIFETWSRLRKHLSTHLPNFKCDYCKKPFRIKSCLIAHIRKHMLNEGFRKPVQLKRYTCSLCSASLLGRASLKRHIASVHYKNNEENPKKADKNKARVTRKDKGIPKKSMATCLSSVFLDTQLESKLINGESVWSNFDEAISTNQIVESQMVLVDESASESDAPDVLEVKYNQF